MAKRLTAILILVFVYMAPNIVIAQTAQNAQQTSGKDNSAQIASMIVAMMMLMQCAQGNPAACAMAALAAAQAAAAGNSSKGAAGVGSAQSQTQANKPPDVKIPTGAPGAGATLGDVLKKAADAGIKFGNGTATLPDGKTIALNGGSGTDAGLKAAGFTDAQIAAAKAAAEDAKGKLAALGPLGGPVTEGGTGGVGGGGGGGSGGSFAAVADNKKQNKPSLSGLSKNLGGDKIGVSADNVFEMVTRRYKAIDATDTFIKN